MPLKTDVQVLIGGKIYTLSGYESEEYLQKIALYINNKIVELNQMAGFKRLSGDMQKILLELNLADDFHKARQRISLMEADIEEKNRLEYDMKHQLIDVQIQLEDSLKKIEELKEEINDLQKQIVKLEISNKRNV